MLKLRRITTGASWIPQIDGLRFVAIFAVLLFHASGEANDRGLAPIVLGAHWTWIDYVLHYGDRGVSLFFVISGYILARPFLRQHLLGGHPVKLSAYYLRRVTRLEPPYILSLLIYAVGEHLSWHMPVLTLLPHLLASLFYMHNLVYGKMSLINFVTWSLEVEIQFYLIAPLMGMFYRIQSTAMRRSLLFLSVCLMGLVSPHNIYYDHLPLLSYMQFFLAGFLLADLIEFPRHQGHTAWRWDLVSLLGWPLIFCLPQVPTILAWLPFLIIPVYLAAFYGRASNWFFRQPVIALTGGMCYSIYLIHTFVISIVFKAVEHLRFENGVATLLTQMTLLVLPALMVATAYFVLVERPCMDPAWPKKLWHRLRGRVPAA